MLWIRRAGVRFMHIIGTIIIGFLAGVVAKLLMPGRDPGGFIVTTLLGIVGAFVATYRHACIARREDVLEQAARAQRHVLEGKCRAVEQLLHEQAGVELDRCRCVAALDRPRHPPALGNLPSQTAGSRLQAA